MTNQEILEKAFMIATHYGFRQREIEPDVFMIPEAFIYRHDFAKALWGDGNTVEVPEIGGGTYTHHLLADYDNEAEYAWQYHLQQMVIAKDPIKYLGEHI